MPSFRILLPFLLLLFSVELSADHLAGGYISYRYIGDSTGIQHHYEVKLNLYLDATGVSLPSFARVQVKSQCYNTQNVICNLRPGTGRGNVPQELYDCISSPAGIKVVDHYLYVGRVVLPGTCSSFSFSYKSCCRPGGYSNAQANGGFFIESWLNNLNGPNSLPHFYGPPLSSTCIQAVHRWKLGGMDQDGDSLHYRFVSPRTDHNSTVPFFNHFSFNQPVSSVPTGSLDPQTGVYTTFPYQVETDILSIRCDEYRKVSSGSYVKVGSVTRDATLNITRSCRSDVTPGLVPDVSVSGGFTEPNTGHIGYTYPCKNTSYSIPFLAPIDPESLDTTVLSAWNSNGNKMVLDSITLEENKDGALTSIVLYTTSSGIWEPGDYFIRSEKGIQGNTLLNLCGFPWRKGDTVILRIQKCPDLFGRGDGKAPVDLLVPNVFTPNQDGLNDAFYLPNIDLFEGEKYVLIMDRWGKRIYETNDYSNMDPWRGENLLGQKCADGPYFYIIRIKDPRLKKEITKEGTVTILRGE